jgi:hypothetical protein
MTRKNNVLEGFPADKVLLQCVLGRLMQPRAPHTKEMNNISRSLHTSLQVETLAVEDRSVLPHHLVRAQQNLNRETPNLLGLLMSWIGTR